MQKKIIALAVAAVVSAPAFADVTPYGIIDGAVARVSATGQKSDTLALSGGASTSRIGVKVTEDLGNGLSAVGVLEYGLDTETNQQSTTTPTITPSAGTATSSSVTASNLAARQQMLALAGSFGTVATGYLQTAGYDFAGKFDVLSGSSASPLQSVTKGGGFLIGSVAAAARAQRALAYISPDISGLTLAVNYATDIRANASLGNLTVADTAADVKVTATLASATYVAGPLTAGAVYAATGNPVSTNDVTEYALGGSYDLGVAKLLGTYQSSTKNSVTNSAYSLTGVMPVGANAVALSYAKNSMNVANTNGSGFTLGYLHTLSKTTTAYAAYSSVSNDSGTNAYSVDNNILAGGTWARGGSSSLVAVGLRKKF